MTKTVSKTTQSYGGKCGLGGSQDHTYVNTTELVKVEQSSKAKFESCLFYLLAAGAVAALIIIVVSSL